MRSPKALRRTAVEIDKTNKKPKIKSKMPTQALATQRTIFIRIQKTQTVTAKLT
jgi:hypothetical protein